jgi:hypothetical protein
MKIVSFKYRSKLGVCRNRDYVGRCLHEMEQKTQTEGEEK